MATEIVVGKRGRITIPAWVRKKYNVEGRVKFIETEEGILLQPKQSIWALFWDMIDANSDLLLRAIELLDELRQEDEDE